MFFVKYLFMINIEKRLINFIELNIEPGQQYSKEVILYGFRVFMGNATAFLLILLISFLIGTVKEAIIIYITFTSLRVFSGGFHTSNPRLCLVLTVTTFVLLSFFASFHELNLSLEYYLILTLAVLSFSGITLYVLAPVQTPNKPLGKKQSILLRKKSFRILIFWGVVLPGIIFFKVNCFVYNSIILGLFAQSFVLWLGNLSNKKGA